MKKILAPSILSADFTKLGEQIKTVENAGAEYLHIDVMDGMFVPNISFGIPVIKSIRPCSGIFFDVHLMVAEPIRYIDAFRGAGADLIMVHEEACKDVELTLRKINDSGVKSGISIKPETPVEDIKPYLDMVDMVLVMSVEPGFGGQQMWPNSPERVSAVREIVEKSGRNIDIEVDGGITTENVKTIVDAGANVIVAGSAVFGGDISGNVKKFLEIMNG